MIDLLRDYASQYLVMATVLTYLNHHGRTQHIHDYCFILLPVILGLSQVFLSERYYYLMDYFQVAYYPSSKRIFTNAQSACFPDIHRSTIEDQGENEVREMTGFNKRKT